MDSITLDRQYLKNEVINPLSALYGEIEATGKVTSTEELEVVLIKLNETLKKST